MLKNQNTKEDKQLKTMNTSNSTRKVLYIMR